jgi:hypothetical protein
MAGEAVTASRPIEAAPTLFSLLRDSALVLAVLLAFIGQAFPYGFPLFLAAAVPGLALSLLCRSWSAGVGAVELPLDAFGLAVLFALVCFLYGILMTTRTDTSLLGETANGVGTLVLYTGVVNAWPSAEARERLASHILRLLVMCTTAIGILGAYKFFLLLNGRQLGFVASQSTGPYPWGTSLVQDYNMFALVILTGLLAACAEAVRARGVLRRFTASAVFLLLCIVGFFAGSRRFWIITPIAVLALLWVSAKQAGAAGVLRAAAATGIAAVVVVLGLIIGFHGQLDLARLTSAGWNLESRLATLGDPQGGFGLDSRVSHWNLAYQLLDGWWFWTGAGFDYLHIFGCRFGNCAVVDYPHNLLLSALLYGGILGCLSVMALAVCLVALARHLVASRSRLNVYGIILLAYLPFVAISSNAVFSVKSFLTTGAICALLNRSEPKK